jgi:hypothetical protein
METCGADFLTPSFVFCISKHHHHKVPIYNTCGGDIGSLNALCDQKTGPNEIRKALDLDRYASEINLSVHVGSLFITPETPTPGFYPYPNNSPLFDPSLTISANTESNTNTSTSSNSVLIPNANTKSLPSTSTSTSPDPSLITMSNTSPNQALKTNAMSKTILKTSPIRNTNLNTAVTFQPISAMSMHTPLVNVLISVYNGGKYLRKCLLSILSQSQGCIFEIVLVDDGSTDKTLEIAQDVLNHVRNGIYSKNAGVSMRIVPLPRTGLSGALDIGLAECRCHYIARIDCDDLCQEGLFAYIYRFF